MPDFKYDVTAVWNVTRYKACRYAVLTPLIHRWKDLGVETAMQRLRGLWCARLHELKDNGWLAIDRPEDVQYMRNCPPFGVLTDTKARCCRRLACPFCFARQVVLEAFSRVELAVYGSHDSVDDATGRWKKAPDGYHLVEWCRTGLIKRPAAVQGHDSAGNVVSSGGWNATCLQLEVMPKVIESMRAGRLTELALLRPVVAATVLLRVEPAPEGMYVRRSGLAVIAHRLPRAFPREGEKFQTKFHPTFDKKTLALACGRVLRYPARLLNGDVAESVEVLNALSRLRVRMVSHFGTRRETKSHFLGVPDLEAEEEEA